MDATASAIAWTKERAQPSWLTRLFDWKPFLIFVCMLPAVGLLMVFLTYAEQVDCGGHLIRVLAVEWRRYSGFT